LAWVITVKYSVIHTAIPDANLGMIRYSLLKRNCKFFGFLIIFINV
jgi:hypothetical protein